MIPKFRAYSVEENIMYYPDEDKNVEWTIDDDTGLIAPLINLENGIDDLDKAREYINRLQAYEARIETGIVVKE